MFVIDVKRQHENNTNEGLIIDYSYEYGYTPGNAFKTAYELSKLRFQFLFETRAYC